MRAIIFFLFSTILVSCSTLLYYPSRDLYINTELLKYQPEEVRFTNRDGVALGGWYFKSSTPAKGIIILFHGNAQNMSAHFYSLFWILDHGYDYFVFDYPGYGPSDGDSTPQNTVESGLAAIDYIQSKHKEPLIIFGQSLGGAVSTRSLIEIKDKHQICAAAVESTFYSYIQGAKSVMKHHAVTWLFQPLAPLLFSDTYSPAKEMDKIKEIPWLSIHRKNDRVVAYNLGEELFELSQAKKQLVTLEGTGHIDAFTGYDKVSNQKIFLTFLQESLASCPYQNPLALKH